MIEQIPPHVLSAVVRRPHPVLVDSSVESISGSSGAATAAVTRISGTALVGPDSIPFSLVRKQFRQLSSGRHALASTDPRHWAYWRRELLAYESGWLPSGPGMSAPRCYGIAGDVLYLEDVNGDPESAAVAARRLGHWQAHAAIPKAKWLSGHQLAQRIAVSQLDWSTMSEYSELAAIWRRRDELLAALDSVPSVLVHGDFHAGNLLSAGESTLVLDWSAVGVGPVGADLAHLALSVQHDVLTDYLVGLDGRFDSDLVRLGYRTTLVLTGASRVHWMLDRGVRIPDGFVEFVLA